MVNRGRDLYAAFTIYASEVNYSEVRELSESGKR
jgi:hypothetical protein